MKHDGVRWFHRSLRTRLSIAAMLLLCALVAQASAIRYLQGGPPPQVASLQKPLAALPMHLGSWHAVPSDARLPEHTASSGEAPEQPSEGEGQTRGRSDGEALLRFATERLRRDYRHERSGQRVAVWIAYSPDGADRQHHPEVCLSVAGQQEDPKGRGRLAVGDQPQPIRRYRFVDGQRGQWLFYWYYTLRPEPTAGSGTLRMLYHRIRHRPASVTIEVFAPDTGRANLAEVQEFVARLDAELQKHLPDRAVRGSQPLSITVVRSDNT